MWKQPSPDGRIWHKDGFRLAVFLDSSGTRRPSPLFEVKLHNLTFLMSTRFCGYVRLFLRIGLAICLR